MILSRQVVVDSYDELTDARFQIFAFVLLSLG